MIKNQLTPDQPQANLLLKLLNWQGQFPEANPKSASDWLAQSGWIVGEEFPDWIKELKDFGLIYYRRTGRFTNQIENDPTINITPLGCHFVLSMPELFRQQQFGATFDIDEYLFTYLDQSKLIWSVEGDFFVTNEDRSVGMGHNRNAFQEYHEAADALVQALENDHEISRKSMVERDNLVREVSRIRILLETDGSNRSKILAVGWGVFGYIMSHFSDRPVSMLAEAAWNALKNLIGL